MALKYRVVLLALYAVFMFRFIMNIFVIPKITDQETLNAIGNIYMAIGSIAMVAALAVVLYPTKKK